MKNFWKRHLDKLGAVGALFSVLCCIGAPAIVSLVFAIGLGFLINDAILIPLLALFLVSTLVGLFFEMRRQGNPWAFILGIASAIIAFFFIAIIFNKILAITGISGLILSSLLNFLFQNELPRSKLRGIRFSLRLYITQQAAGNSTQRD